MREKLINRLVDMGGYSIDKYAYGDGRGNPGDSNKFRDWLNGKSDDELLNLYEDAVTTHREYLRLH